MVGLVKKSFYYYVVVINPRKTKTLKKPNNIGVITMSKAKAFKTSDYLKSNEDRAEYLKAIMAQNNEGLLMLAIREIIDSMGGIGKLAKETGLARESLYRTFSKKGNPTYNTLFKVLDNIGLQLSVSVK